MTFFVSWFLFLTAAHAEEYGARDFSGAVKGPQANVLIENVQSVDVDYGMNGSGSGLVVATILPTRGVYSHLILNGYLVFNTATNQKISMPVIVEADHYGPQLPLTEGVQWFSKMALHRLRGKKIEDVFRAPFYGGNADLHVLVGVGGEILANSHGIVLTEVRSSYKKVEPGFTFRVLNFRPANDAQFDRVRKLEIQ